MSPAALKLLTMAYENYLKTYETYFSYQFKDSDDFINSINGANQLFENGYIDNVSDNAFSRIVNLVPLDPIAFEITDSGIEYMRSNRKL